MKKVVFLHTISSLADMFNRLAENIFKQDVEVFHIVDELIRKEVLDKGAITPSIYRRICEHFSACENNGANMIIITCSSIASCTEIASLLVNIPVMRIDEAMIDKAISMGNKIGIAATTKSAIAPTADLLFARAAVYKKKVDITHVICGNAYEAMLKGDMKTHNEIVSCHIKSLMPYNDVIVLAQVSMTQVLDCISKEDMLVPVLASPVLALEKAYEILNKK